MVYLLIFALSTGMLGLSEKYRKKNAKITYLFFICLSLLLPSILAGVRDYTIGNDVLLYGNYWFEEATQYTSLYEYLIKATEYSVGIGYAFVNFAVSRISSNAHVFYFLYELLQLIVLYKGLEPFKDEMSIPFGFTIYYFSYYNLSLSMLRQIMAIVIVIFAYRYVVNKKLIKFIIAIMLAVTFHSTAIVAIVLYPLNWAMNSKWRRAYKALIVGVASAGVLLYQQVFNWLINFNILSSERYSHYLTDTLVGGRFIRLSYWGLILICVLLTQKRCIKYSSRSNLLVIITIISAIMTLLTFIGSTWVIRMAYYFDAFEIYMLPLVAKNTKLTDKSLKKATPYVGIMLVIVIYWLITFIIRNGAVTYPFVFMTY